MEHCRSRGRRSRNDVTLGSVGDPDFFCMTSIHKVTSLSRIADEVPFTRSAFH